MSSFQKVFLSAGGFAFGRNVLAFQKNSSDDSRLSVLFLLKAGRPRGGGLIVAGSKHRMLVAACKAIDESLT